MFVSDIGLLITLGIGALAQHGVEMRHGVGNRSHSRDRF